MLKELCFKNGVRTNDGTVFEDLDDDEVLLTYKLSLEARNPSYTWRDLRDSVD
jgi:hypothetical protein